LHWHIAASSGGLQAPFRLSDEKCGIHNPLTIKGLQINWKIVVANTQTLAYI
jgi:hypothetical protein